MKAHASLFGAAAFALCLAAAGAAHAKVKVVVASESWATLMYLDQKGVPRGDIVDFVHRMNEVQDKFHFEFVIYPRLRVDAVFIAKGADVYPLRTVAWTKPALNLLPTRTLFASGDVYFAKSANRFGGAKVFDDLPARSVAGVRGYHYRLFNNNPDENYVRKNHNAYLVGSNEAVVTYVLAGRADVGIVPEVIMAKYFEDPKMRAQLIVAEEFDSRVDFSNLVRKDGPISVADMNAVVDLLVKSGDVARLKARLSLQQHRQPKK